MVRAKPMPNIGAIDRVCPGKDGTLRLCWKSLRMHVREKLAPCGAQVLQFRLTGNEHLCDPEFNLPQHPSWHFKFVALNAIDFLPLNSTPPSTKYSRHSMPTSYIRGLAVLFMNRIKSNDRRVWPSKRVYPECRKNISENEDSLSTFIQGDRSSLHAAIFSKPQQPQSPPLDTIPRD